jgi:glutathione peroxidase
MKRFFILLLILPALLLVWIMIDNRNSVDMTIRQKILKTIYPMLTGLTRLAGANSKSHKPPFAMEPPVSVYSLKILLNSGEEISMNSLRGKKVLLVNTASDCGYTAQYEDLQALQKEYDKDLVIIGFPANDFKQQEKGSDAQIAEFCKINFGVTFPLAAKSSVLKGDSQHPVFRWLSDKDLNGWNSQAPIWNFSKYLIDDQGRLAGVFEPSVAPGAKEIVDLLEAAPGK